jgi:hypothetical protein
MKKEIKIDLTPEEIQMTRSFCKDTIKMKPKNVNLISSVLSKIDSQESSEPTIRIKSTGGKKGGRPRKVISPIPEPLEVIPEIITSIEEPKLIGKKRGRPRKEVPLLSEPDHEETSILSDLIEEPKPSGKKRGRPKRVFKSEEQKEVSYRTEPETPKIKEVPSINEPEPIEVKEVPSKIEPETVIIEVEEVQTNPEPETQLIPSTDTTEKVEVETGQTTNTDSEKPKLSRFQKFLKKLRPSKDQ